MKPRKSLDVSRFTEHLLALLPLRAPSGVRGTAVERYCLKALHDMGREPDYDKFGNITALAGPRAIVAHTDAVSQQNGRDHEPVIYQNGVFTSRRGKRPIGGDDKVGIAVALTIAASYPDISVLLPSDEEIGCVGSRQLRFKEPFDLAVQCDRRGINDLVLETGWLTLTSPEARKAIRSFLPYRKEEIGSITDVAELMENGQVNNAINLSCGYFNPHTADEYVVMGYALQALFDAESILVNVPYGLPAAVNQPSYYSDWKDWRKGGYTSANYGGVHYNGMYFSRRELDAVESALYGCEVDAWEEDGHGGYVHRTTFECIDAEAVAAYHHSLGITDAATGSAAGPEAESTDLRETLEGSEREACWQCGERFAAFSASILSADGMDRLEDVSLCEHCLADRSVDTASIRQLPSPFVGEGLKLDL